MANTEGMSDEAVQRLLLSPPTPPGNNNKSASQQANTTTKRRRDALQRRMELPVGDRPAATVVRVQQRPPPTVSSSKKVATPSLDQKQPEVVREPAVERGSQQSSTTTTPPPSSATPSSDNNIPSPNVVGNVMERNRGGRRRRRNNNKSSISTTTGSSKTGFPSVQDQPIGTLVLNKNNKNDRIAKNYSSNNNNANSTAAAAAAAATSDNVNESLPSSSNNNISSLKEATSRDADAMLAQMSQQEIQDNVLELRAALSPETLNFLKRRRCRQNSNNTTNDTSSNSPSQKQSIIKSSSSSDNNNKEPTSTIAREDRGAEDEPAGASSLAVLEEEELREKERLSKVLSSIQTYEDLDAAYAAEMRTTSLATTNDDDSSTVASSNTSISQQRGEKHTTDSDKRDNGGDEEEFRLACDLVRSSVMRQQLWAARVVAKKLRMDYKNIDNRHHRSLRHYPVLLPVSLRCLLDAPPSSNGYVLHTYVLQAIHSLLLLKSCDDHLVDFDSSVRDNNNNNNSPWAVSPSEYGAMYQLYYMEDAVPAPRFGSCACYDSSSADASKPVTPLMPTEGKDGVAGAYATSSSSTSAQADGEAFIKDPTWTLLSKMRILPRLASLLRPSCGCDGDEERKAVVSPSLKLPPEALVATCGILSMVAQRSPGAATAIVHHPTLLSDVLEHTLLLPSNGDNSNTLLGLPAMILLCTIARQSRVAAEGLDIELVLLRVLAATTPKSDQEFELQRWSLVLWRTLLRYGLGLSQLSSLLSIAAPHLTVGPNAKKYSLAPDFFSALACVSNCIRVGRRPKTKKGLISRESMEILSSASTWLSSTAQNALKHITNIDEPGSIFSSESIGGVTRTDRIRFHATCLRFLDSYFLLQLNDDANQSNEEFKMETFYSLDEESCIEALHLLVKSEEFFEALASTMMKSFGQNEDTCLSGDALMGESATCGYLCALLMLVSSLWKHTRDSEIEKLESLVDFLGQRLLMSINKATQDSPSATVMRGAVGHRHWLDKVIIATANFLATARTLGLDYTRAMVFFAIGRLSLGDEGPAAILLSHDGLFQPSSTPVDSLGTSPLSTMLVRELCRTDLCKNQLDHSFKLHGGLGITSSGMGPFGLQSLLSEAENQGSKAERDALLLPMGEFWLWQILSGSLVQDQAMAGNNNGLESEALVILSTCLGLIWEIENSDDPMLQRYIRCLGIGARLYHLCNVCLKPEAVLTDQQIHLSLNSLFRKYSESDEEWVDDFMKACYLHSMTSVRTSVNSLLSLGPNEKKLCKDSLRALEDFVGDLCDAYIEYGVECPSLTRCLRLFLLPKFPSKIRCDVLCRVRGLLHLFTLEDEEDASGLSSLLTRYVVGGMPSISSDRMPNNDSPEVLDSFCAVFAAGAGARFDSAGLVSCTALTVLARSVATSLVEENNSSGLNACKRRMKILDRSFALLVFRVTSLFLSSPGTRSDLVNAAIVVASGTTSSATGENLFPNELLPPKDLNEWDWDRVFDFLRQKVTAPSGEDSNA